MVQPPQGKLGVNQTQQKREVKKREPVFVGAQMEKVAPNVGHGGVPSRVEQGSGRGRQKTKGASSH